MLKNLINGFLASVAIKLLDNYRQLSLRLLKIEATKSYVHGVRLARLSALGLLGMGLLIGLICLGVLLFHVGLFLLLPWSLAAKAVLGMVLGLTYAGIGGGALYAALDEKVWMKKSGAAGMLAEATGRSETD